MRQCSSFNRSIEVFLRNWFEDDLCSVMTVDTFIAAEINAEMIFLQARILQNLAPRSCYYDGVLSRFAMSSKNCLLSEEAIFVVSNLMHLASCFSARWQRQLNESSCVSKYDTWLFATFFSTRQQIWNFEFFVSGSWLQSQQCFKNIDSMSVGESATGLLLLRTQLIN